MVGSWIRPWRGEALCGLVVAVSGDHLVCRAPGGFEFMVDLDDVKRRKMEVWTSPPERPEPVPYKLASDVVTGRFYALPALLS